MPFSTACQAINLTVFFPSLLPHFTQRKCNKREKLHPLLSTQRTHLRFLKFLKTFLSRKRNLIFHHGKWKRKRQRRQIGCECVCDFAVTEVRSVHNNSLKLFNFFSPFSKHFVLLRAKEDQKKNIM